MSDIDISPRLIQLSEQVGELLIKQGLVMASAESCTSGGIAYIVTEIAGSSQWFDRAYVTYSNQSKQQMLGVRRQTLEKHGAVSEATVSEMIMGTLSNSSAGIAVAVSGVAGPSGGSVEKPVGLVWFGWGQAGKPIVTRSECFSGNRHEIRVQTIETAMSGLIRLLTP